MPGLDLSKDPGAEVQSRVFFPAQVLRYLTIGYRPKVGGRLRKRRGGDKSTPNYDI
jgi:hypothetical protein